MGRIIMSKPVLAAAVFLALSATVATAHDAQQLRYELQDRGYSSIRFLVPEAPFQVGACRGGTRFHLHVDWYGRITERAVSGPCRLHGFSEDGQDRYRGRRNDRDYDDYRYRR